MAAWTAEEDSILEEAYPEGGPQGASEALGERGFSRTPASCSSRAQSLGVYCRQGYSSWTEEQLAILMEWYPAEGKKVMARLPGKSLKNVQVTAHRLGVKKLRPFAKLCDGADGR